MPVIDERFAWLIKQCGGVVTMDRDDDEEAEHLTLAEEQTATGRVFRALDKSMGS